MSTMGLFGKDDDTSVPSTRRFQMRQQMMSVGDDYWIEDDSGHRAYRVDGKAMHLRDTFILKDAAGHEVAKIQERKLTLRDKMVIERAGGDATVQKKLIGIRDHFKITIDGGHDLEAHGKVMDHEYKVERDGTTIARVSKKWFRVRESYGIEIEPGEDVSLMLAIAVCLDAMSRG
jgi:uncharacterized protein YxjI